MADPTVLTEIAGRIAIVTINRPEKLNALNTPVRTALVAALDEGWADPVRLSRGGRRASLMLDQAGERIGGALSPYGQRVRTRRML